MVTVFQSHSPGRLGAILLSGGIFLVLAAVGLGVGAGLSYAASKGLVDHGLRAEGTVVELVESGSGKKRCATPRFEFVADDGRVHEKRGKVCSSPPGYRTGEHVTVLYEAGHADDATLEDFTSLWLLPLILALVGGGLLLGGASTTLFGVVVLARARRERANS
ncbi:MAG: DUF3592 domain-containing protein [Polyangiaceae bacterium]|nr:DUF3592 domain-containing protein [Polyangiaceae bacterium]